MSDAPRVTKTFVYLSETPIAGDPTKVAAYLVERVKHETIVANMTLVGEFDIESAELDLEEHLDKRGMKTAGQWELLKKGTHRYKRVVRGSFE